MDSRICFYEYGVGAENIIMFFSGNHGEVDESAKVLNGQEDNCTEIEIIRLDDIICEPISYLKMDIEGMELSALRGGGETD